MIPEERRRRIVDLLVSGGLIRGDELADALTVSPETVRRDLLVLEERGEIRRVYGGAVATTRRAVEASFESRRFEQVDCKKAMAKAAVELVASDDTIVFDIGTSVTEVARALPTELPGLVLTNSLPAASELSEHTRLTVLTSGGRLRRGDLACSGGHAMDFFRGYYADKAFLGSGGVHPRAGLTDYYTDEITVRNVMIDNATEAYVLADCSKLGHIAVARVGPLSRLSGVITDDHADAQMVEALIESGVRVLVAPVTASNGVPATASEGRGGTTG